jgi:hypothetical protein
MKRFLVMHRRRLVLDMKRRLVWNGKGGRVPDVRILPMWKGKRLRV